MTLNKQALLIPERKRHDWSQAVMRDCDFCSQWSLTVKHENGGHICASCCDAEYTSELKCALEVAIERADAAEKRLEELEARTVTVKLPELCVGVVQEGHAVMVPYAAGHWFNKTAILEMLAAAGIKIKGE